MKISLAWVLDHCEVNSTEVDVAFLIEHFNTTVAEIEHVQKIDLTPIQFDYGVVKEIYPEELVLETVEHQHIRIAIGAQQTVKKGEWYILEQKGQDRQWHLATLATFNPESRSIFLAPVQARTAPLFKQEIELRDTIFDIDNKSITHRPDLWSHRGIARECALILQVPLKNNSQLQKEWKSSWNSTVLNKSSSNKIKSNYTLSIEAPDVCKRYCAGLLTISAGQASSLFIAQRLARLDARPINGVIDATNYVMYDVGQPLHAFDAATISEEVRVRYAHQKEPITLLDGTEIALTSQDLVIADAHKPCALAGISGALTTGVTSNTTQVLLEAAQFDASSIRKTAARVKVRTQAAMRFEKSIDPDLTLEGMRRFLSVLEHSGISYTLDSDIAVQGVKTELVSVGILHGFIEDKLGCVVSVHHVTSILTCLGYTVTYSQGEYAIGIPSFRATKDVSIKEDIVEEIGRVIGYNTITPHPMMRAMKPFSLHALERRRALKRYLAYGAHMREICMYGLYDETFLSQLEWNPQAALLVANPLSENYKRLVTSLIPHVLKAVSINNELHPSVRFFEYASVWNLEEQGTYKEQKNVAGIIYQSHAPINFYEGKQCIDDLARALKVSFEWVPVTQEKVPSWYDASYSACIRHQGTIVGYAGILNKEFSKRVVAGHGFIFELNGRWLVEYQPPIVQYAPVSKFPAVHRDISVLLPYDCTVTHCISELKNSSTAIVDVQLIDTFQKAEWKNKRSVTFRLTLRSLERTFTTEEIDAIYAAAITVLQNNEGVIR